MSFGRGRRGSAGGVEPPIELRFVDLFMILVTALIFINVVMIAITASMKVSDTELRVTTRGAPDALAGRPYRLDLAALGGAGAYRWAGGEGLPEGLSIEPEGAIAGTPARPQQTRFVVRVSDAQGKTAEATLDLRVSASEGITPEPTPPPALRVAAARVALPDAVGKQEYRAELKAENAAEPVRWNLTEGALPPGLEWSPDGVITGTPTEWERPSSFTMTAADATGKTVTQAFGLAVAAPTIPLWQKLLWWGFVVLYLFFSIRLFWRGGSFLGLRDWWRSRG